MGDGHQVVVYDGAGIFSAARVWWNFPPDGQDRCRLLDGGLPKWRAEGREIEDMAPIIRDRHITVQRQAHLVKRCDAGRLGLQAGGLADRRRALSGSVSAARNRSRARGCGRATSPARRTCIYASLLNPDGTMKGLDELPQPFRGRGVDVARRTITTCGSGVTAAIVMLALHRLGNMDVSLYDGSWSEWGRFEQLQVRGPDDRHASGDRGFPIRSPISRWARAPIGRCRACPTISGWSARSIRRVWYFPCRSMTRSARDYEWQDRFDQAEADPAALQAFVRDPDVVIWTAMGHGWPQGFFMLDWRKAGVCDLAYFGLVPQAVGAGWGRALLETALLTGWAREGVAKMTVNTCTLDHPRALSLYQKLGFTPVAREERRRVLVHDRDPSRFP